MLWKVYVVFNVYIGEMGPLFFNDLIQTSPLEQSKLNQIYLLGKGEPPLKLLL